MRRRLVVVLAIALASCGREEVKKKEEVPAPAAPKALEAPAPVIPKAEPVARDLDAIDADRTLRVLFTFNTTGYFIYRGETMGYEFELLSRFARERKLRLVPVVLRDSRGLYTRLNAGEGDIVAAQLVETPNESEVKQTAGLYETKPVVVQRADASKPVEIRARLVDTPAELAGRQVHLSRSSPFRRNLLELNEELTQDIEVVEVDATADRLIDELAEGQIGYTVAAENLAALKKNEYTNLVIKPAIGPPQQVVWGVRTNAPMLHDALNLWIARQRKSGLLNVLYKKYFLDRRAYTRRAVSRYLTVETGTLSPYDEWFREYARIPGWDWRLVASQAYQESRFNPNARSWAGAIGLMQIMPRTARELKVNPRDVRQSIEGACRYLWKMDDRWKKVIPSESERTKFILASYNVGLGHVEDARRLAEKHGNDPSKWDDVAYWLVRKSTRAVYNDPVVRYGFARGTEPVNYVDAILDRFEHYKAFVTETVESEPESAARQSPTPSP